MLNFSYIRKERDIKECFLKGAEQRVGVKGLQPEMGLVSSTYFDVAMEIKTHSIYLFYLSYLYKWIYNIHGYYDRRKIVVNLAC